MMATNRNYHHHNHSSPTPPPQTASSSSGKAALEYGPIPKHFATTAELVVPGTNINSPSPTTTFNSIDPYLTTTIETSPKHFNDNKQFMSSSSSSRRRHKLSDDHESPPRNRNHQQSRHLIKKNVHEDGQPGFTTIENFRFASYSIAGEPYLCLPQLLHWLRQKFTLQKMIDIFEDSMIFFRDATPRQLDGFIKSSILPISTTSCPLIKRSDADKICLNLFMQFYEGKKKNIVDICLNNQININSSSSSAGSISTPTTSSNARRMGHHRNHHHQQQQQLASKKYQCDSIEDNFTTTLRREVIKDDDGESCNQKCLFDSIDKNQAQIFTLAKSVTSTLMIRIYHRCFGKCAGLYYPRLLNATKKALCIECSTCHVMLSPRLFIGHTHGSRERNVCHWGFNSYNWNYYIILSTKQTMNNLDDEELLNHFRILQSARDYIDNEHSEDLNCQLNNIIQLDKKKIENINILNEFNAPSGTINTYSGDSKTLINGGRNDSLDQTNRYHSNTIATTSRNIYDYENRLIDSQKLMAKKGITTNNITENYDYAIIKQTSLKRPHSINEDYNTYEQYSLYNIDQQLNCCSTIHNSSFYRHGNKMMKTNHNHSNQSTSLASNLPIMTQQATTDSMNTKQLKNTINTSHQPSTSNSIAMNFDPNLTTFLNSHYILKSSPKISSEQQQLLLEQQQQLKAFNRIQHNHQLHNQQQQSNRHHHLIKTIEDLPVFTTIGNYRIASYSMAGEPYLCLPQLLQLLKEKFTIRRMIRTFEESLVLFRDATPKQVEGFIKSSILPINTTSCPLIKRSDADNICLSLFMQCYKSKKNNIVSSICSTKQDNNSTNNSAITIINDTPTKTSTATIRQSYKKSICDNFKGFEEGGGQEVENNEVNNEEDHQTNINEIKVDQHLLFKNMLDNREQAQIFTLAKSVTSTIMIRISHRCFGKCAGLYYPSLLITTRKSLCIECLTCHIMLSPRLFISHTHGSKENHVCHWGFNSSNWNRYITLSKKQTMNNLDDEELLNQFKILQSARDYIDNENMSDSDYEFDQPETEDEGKLGATAALASSSSSSASALSNTNVAGYI